MRQLVIVSAGTSQPSTTRMLADRIAAASVEVLGEMGVTATTGAIEVAPLAVDVARASVTGVPSQELQAALDQIAAADAVIASAPVYKAGLSGLFKSFVDVLDNDLLIAKPVVLAATAGSARHALVVDEQMRSLFAYMRALTLPTAVFAAPEDWGAAELGERVRRAGTELVRRPAGWDRAGNRRSRLVRLPARVRGQRDPCRADGRGHRLRLAADATRRRRPHGLTSESGELAPADHAQTIDESADTLISVEPRR